MLILKAWLTNSYSQPIAMHCRSLPMVTNVNNGKLTDFAVISLPKIAGNKI